MIRVPPYTFSFCEFVYKIPHRRARLAKRLFSFDQPLGRVRARANVSRIQFLNELYECEKQLDRCILYAHFELDLSYRIKIIS